MISIRKVLVFTGLLIASAALWYANSVYQNEYLLKAFYTFAALAVVYAIFKIVVEDAITGTVKDSRRKFELRRIVSIINAIVVIAVVITIWIPNPEAILVAYGLIAAAIAIALQDVFKNMAGGAILLLTRVYSVGDRVQIDSVYGDVVNIGIFYTTLLETREWIEGDQATGRLTIIPNSHVISGIIQNYTAKDHEFIWDEIWVQ
ncbi:MAG: mechanosensitive ion channel [Candidatus Micrarchaeia archaeon]